MKNALGGFAEGGGGGTCSCSCNGQAGSWEYTGQPSGPEMVADIKTYCRDGAVCSNGCTIYMNP